MIEDCDAKPIYKLATESTLDNIHFVEKLSQINRVENNNVHNATLAASPHPTLWLF